MAFDKLACSRRWHKLHPGRQRDIGYFGGNRELAIARDGGKCVMCGMTRDEHKRKFKRDITVDHKDGKGINSKVKNHALDNLQTLCCPCHGKKDGLMRKKWPVKSMDSLIRFGDMTNWISKKPTFAELRELKISELLSIAMSKRWERFPFKKFLIDYILQIGDVTKK
ncbi:MAG: HNH endonuclease [Bacteroidia bacterium]|nr:HNH endonuclease [Bacteroidia bacterium]